MLINLSCLIYLINISFVWANDNVYFSSQPRIVSQNGHLIFYAAEHKNISLQTQGKGGVHINGVDLTETAKLSNKALKVVNSYQATFGDSMEKITKLNQFFDEGLMEKLNLLQNGEINVSSIVQNNAGRNTTSIASNSRLFIRIRRLNKRVTTLQNQVNEIKSLLVLDDCLSNPCRNGGTCQDLFNNFICQCPPQWEGPRCDKDVNECSRFVGTDLGCQNGATCVNRVGSYECLCLQGWFGLHCSRRSTDCQSGSNAELCGHGTCITQYDTIGYKCLCDPGWTTDGRTPPCNTDENECAAKTPRCSVNPLVECINLPGSFHCGSCPQGYRGNGFYCTDINECATNNGGCSSNPMVACINTQGSRVCGPCPTGFKGDGVTCGYYGTCSINNGGCHALATCRANPTISSTSIECICPAGYIGNGMGPSGCTRSLQPSQENPCNPTPCDHGICLRNGTGYMCICYSRYTGTNCNKIINPCSKNPCKNGGTCSSLHGYSFRCTCTSTFTGSTCETERQACGGRLEMENGTLVYPTIQSRSYEHAISCAWTIKTNEARVLNVTFKRFSVEESNNCKYDWLQIHDGDNTLARSIGRFCGHNLPNGGNIISTHNIIYLWFRSDHSVAFDGFELSWISVNPYCGEPLKEVTSHGTIESPGSPGIYPNNRDCYWPLQAPMGKRLIFHFFRLMIGNDSDCTKDYLEFITGTEPIDPVFAKFCNTTHPSPIYSSGPEVLVHFHSDRTKSYQGFQVTYSVTEGMPGCGGVYTHYQDEIRSPSYDNAYPNDIYCEYRIQLTEKSRIKLTFLSFSLESSDRCQFDYVAIHSGSTSDSPLIGQYCGDTVPAPYVSETNILTVIFKTDWAVSEGGFVMRYETVCGGKYIEPSGIIESPGYPNNYPHSVQCIYEIVQPLGRVIELKILDLDLEANIHPQCIYDSLEVRDGHDANSSLIGTYCDRPPPLIVSTYNYLWMKFIVDATANGRGFQANYTTTKLGCGGIIKDKSGVITSPNYPDVYSPSIGCNWIIAAPPGNVIQIIWQSFQLEQNYDCSYDYVQVFDNDTATNIGVQIGKFCGQKNPPILLSSSNMMTIVFKSDHSFNLGGFSASYNFLLEKNVCGGNYYTTHGTLKTPNYPNSYPLNVDCTWTIQVPSGHQILLNVTDFSLENYSICRYDYLEIRNGGTASSPLLGKYCGKTIPKMIPSHANRLYLQFRSDMTRFDRGFKIIWESVATGCGGTLTGPTGAIISPNYPEPYTENTECIWKIFINVGSLIQLVFTDFDLEHHALCHLDYVEIFDGPNLQSKSLGKYCTPNPQIIKSTSNSLTIKFISDLSRNGRGFQLQYTTLCNNTLSGFNGVIESPNFPSSYPTSVNCNWEIQVAEGNKINISFSHFNLEKTTNSSNCLYDYVEILYKKSNDEYEDPNPKFQKHGTYCGNEIPPYISLNASIASVHFVTDNLIHGNGFRLEWQIFGCGEILTHPTGTIMSPNYPNPYPAGVECNWKIEADFGNHIEITFHKVEIEQNSMCNIDYVALYNGEDSTYPEIAAICRQLKPITLRSTGNFMFVRFKTDRSIEGRGFYANYTTKPTKCGGKYIADKGIITSPNYPNNYDVNDTCSYEIEVASSHIIDFNFEDFDFYGFTNCSFDRDYVKLYDGANRNAPIIAQACGKKFPNGTIKSSSNIVLLEMVTNSSLTAKGFKAKYQKACGARIIAENFGDIKVNPNDIDYNQQNCTWTIIAKDLTKHIYLTVTHLDDLSNYCDDNYKSLTIYNGESAEAPVLGEYCGSKVPPTLTSEGSALHIVLTYNTAFNAAFSVFESSCGGTLTALNGSFASPGYPKRYPMNTACEWTIDVTEGNHVSLSFSYFDLLDSEYCNTDYLEIRQNNGNGKHLGSFCGNDIPTNITNMGSLWIYLKTSKIDGVLGSSKGFYAEYYLNHDNILYGPSGRIVSPLYDLGLPFYGDYTWTINVDYGKRVLLTFQELYLENGGSDYCYASITVYDGEDTTSPSTGEYCNENNKTIKSATNVVHLVFTSYSSSRTVEKFIITWLQIDSSVPALKPSEVKIKGCGSEEPIDLNILRNSTTITSPGYPNGYANNLICEWIFTTIPMNRIMIFFTAVDLQRNYGPACYADYIEIFEKQANSDWSSINKVCHENTSAASSFYGTNLMKLVFKSDRFANGTGFQAYVGQDCGGTLTDPSGYIIYNNETRSGYRNVFTRQCQWNITVKSGRTIEIEFLDFYIYKPSNEKCKNYIMLRNGRFSDSPVLGQGKYCGESKPPQMKTTGNNAYVIFSGTSAVANFKIRYREILYSCGGEIALSQFSNDTEISTPNYPNVPPAHLECFWRITAPPGENLRIDFVDHFDMNPNSECTKEYVEIRDGGTQYSKLINKFCSLPDSQFTTGNLMFIKFFTDLPDPSNGFKAKIKIGSCGGTIRGSTGKVQSPFFNVKEKFPIKANCTWRLFAPPEHAMDIVFKKIDLPLAENCSDEDYVRIYEKNPINEEVNSLGRFCGSVIPEKISSTQNEVYVQFQTSKTKKTFSGFWLQFNSSIETCGGTIEASEGIIQSPKYPDAHKNERHCEWRLVAPRGRRITLKVVDFNLDTRLSGSYLTGLSFYNSKKYVSYVQTITERTTLKVVESSDNELSVFYWAPRTYGRGFQAKFTSNEPSICIGDLSQSSGTIRQPITPSTYYCTYDRNVPSSQSTTVALTVQTTVNVTVPGKKGCQKYYGNIYIKTKDEKRSIGEICVPSSNTIVRSPYSNFKIEAYQSYPARQVNFTISYKTYQCGGVLNSASGTIRNPDYLSQNPKSVECAWLIEVAKDSTIWLTFDSLNLGTDCEKSFLDVYNGYNSKSPKIDRFCNSNKPNLIRSQSNTLLVEYKFDDSSNGKGFTLKYESKTGGCGGVFHDRTKIIETPSYPDNYPSNSECLWELVSDPGYHVALVFYSRFQIEESENCQNDYVEIWNWKDSWVSMGKKCGRDIPKTINSTSNKIKILFRSNDKINGQGFQAKWEWNCGGEFHADNTERFIVSPGFPIVYNKNMHCQYNITAQRGEFINIKFYDFELEGFGSNCKFDNISISNIWQTSRLRNYPYYKQVFCGSKVPAEVRLSNNIFITFMTDAYLQKAGFRFSYQLDNCGGQITTPTIISTPSMNKARIIGLYNSYILCKWNITAPKDKIIVARFQQFHFEFKRTCYFDNVEIFDDIKPTLSKRIANLCGDLSSDPPAIKSTSNSMFISMKADRTLNHTGFVAEIFFVYGPQAGCGGNINLTQATTLQPPTLYNLDCTWIVTSPVGTSVKISFTEFNLATSCSSKKYNLGNCTCDFVEVRDGKQPSSELMEKICAIISNNVQKDLTSSTNSLSLRLVTSSTNNKAFKATLTPIPSICGSVYLNVTNEPQILKSPNYPNKYPNDIRCSWLLKSAAKFVVRFIDLDLNENNGKFISNNCGVEKLQINEDLSDYRPYNVFGRGPLIISGSRRNIPEFSSYSQVIGSYQYCGQSDKPFDYYSNTYSLTIKFASGNNQEKRGKGFKLEYFTVGCNSNYTDIQGRLMYTINKDCIHLITVPKNYTIALYFQQFAIYNTQNCTKVGLEIRDGASQNSKLLQRICNYALPNPVFSTTNNLWIHSWNTMGSSISGSFDLVYTSSDKGKGCGGVLYNYKGRFTSPLHPLGYKSSTECVWEVRVPIGMRVALKISVFDIQGDCKNNNLKITTFDKEDTNDHVFCKNDNPATLYSNSHLRVVYQSSVNNGGAGWVALFEAVS